MEILVLVKPVPVVEEARISGDSKDIDKAELKFFLNELDSYALEEAILKKEKLGGTVTVVALADSSIEDQVNEMIWECYAKGADNGFFIGTDAAYLDAYSKTALFSQFIKERKFDLVLMGVQSSDIGNSLLGPFIANSLKIPYLTMISKLDIGDGKATVNREMEEGYFETLEIPIPCLLTIQTGINTPRYPPFIKVRNAKKIPISKIEASSLVSNLGDSAKLKRERVFIPESRGAVKILEGDIATSSKELVSIIRTLGVNE